MVKEMAKIRREYIDFYPSLSVILIIYLLIINNMQNSFLSFLAIVISIMFINKPLYILPPLFIVSMMGEYFVAFQGIGMSRIMTLAFIFGSFLNFAMKDIKFKIRHFGILVFLCGFNFISSATSITGILTPAITMNLNVLMLFFMYYTVVKDLDLFIKTVRNSLIVLSLYIAYMSITGQAATVVDKNVTRLILDESVNANRLGIALAQIFAFLFGFIIINKSKSFNFFILIILFATAANLLLTGSRSSAISIIVSITIISTINLFKNGRISKRLLTVIATSITMICVYLITMTSQIDVFTRFSVQEILEYGGTGRLDIWMAVLQDVLPNNFLFGVGFGGVNTIEALQTYVGINYGAHNFLIAMLSQVGVIGTIMYLTLFIKSTSKIIEKYRQIEYLIIPITMIISAYINGIGEDIFDSRFLWFDIGLAFLIINNHKEKQDDTIVKNSEIYKTQ